MADITVRKDVEAQPISTTRDVEPFRLMRDMLRADPFRDLTSLLRFDPFSEMTPLYSAALPTAFWPAIEVRETPQSYLFTADVPGVLESDIEVMLTGNRLTISGARRMEKDVQQAQADTWYSTERPYGSFSRSYTLPEGYDPDHIHAELKLGVLTVAISKKPEMQPKKIAIKAAPVKA